jgi:DNA (cytosine-5)-methyltransferase 1
MKGLILYAGCGGFRHGVRNFEGWEWTAVEIRKDICGMYHELFPEDTLIQGDAHQYLLDHYKEYDFIQSSPPCQTHSRIRYCLTRNKENTPDVYPDLTLWQEAIFLDYHFDGVYLLENVFPYYAKCMRVMPDRIYFINRHYIWSNANMFGIDEAKDFGIPSMYHQNVNGRTQRNEINEFVKNNRVWFDPRAYGYVKGMRLVLRNMMEHEIAEYVFRYCHNDIVRTKELENE